jgi:ferredoxin
LAGLFLPPAGGVKVLLPLGRVVVGGSVKPQIDEELCIGDGICEDLCPEVFELRDDGLAHVIIAQADESLREKIEEAAIECPTDAIALEEHGPEEEIAA